MARKFYTLDDLYNFCRENRFESFSADKQGAPLVVQSFGTFEANDKNSDGLMAVKLKSCHTGKNRNKSGITDENMQKYKYTFKGRPILGAIYKTDTGEYEFRAHDMEIVDEGIEYIEQPIGVISQTEEPYLEYDEKEDKNYLMVSGTIFSDYSRAADILERRRTCKCSVEIAVEELSYNCDEDYLSIDKFRFSGVTILGYEQDGVTEIQEGMKGSKITIDDFSEKKNSMFSADCQERLIETLEKLNMTLESFNNTNQNTEKGGEKVMNKFEELCEKYNKTADEVTFEYENLSDEELEVAFKEAFEGDTGADSINQDGDGTSDDNGLVNVNTSNDEDNTSGEDSEGSCELDEEPTSEPEAKFVLKYELSHDDIRSALYSLLYAEADDDYCGTWILEVYDNKFIYQDYIEGKFYRRDYSKDGENVSLGESKVEVFNEWLSQAEKDALDTLKADYSVLKSFKEAYDADQLQAQKDSVFARKEFASIINTKAFKTLMENSKDYTLAECEQKAKTILEDCNDYVANFASQDDSIKKTNTLGFNFNVKPSKKKTAYGGLFDKDE